MNAATAIREPAKITVKNLDFYYGKFRALKDINLEIPEKKVTAFIGPSGCGKSTLLRVFNRMYALYPDQRAEGEILLDGENLLTSKKDVALLRAKVGMVFQKPNPFPAMSIYDNVVAGLRLTGIRAGRNAKDLLVEECLIKAGLWKEVRDRLRQPGGGLSGGQQQRLCIARALELAREVTIVIVTHNMQQAQRVSDNCAFFLAAQGTPGGIVEHGDTTMMFGSPTDSRTSDYVNGRFG